MARADSSSEERIPGRSAGRAANSLQQGGEATGNSSVPSPLGRRLGRIRLLADAEYGSCRRTVGTAREGRMEQVFRTTELRRQNHYGGGIFRKPARRTGGITMSDNSQAKAEIAALLDRWISAFKVKDFN